MYPAERSGALAIFLHSTPAGQGTPLPGIFLSARRAGWFARVALSGRRMRGGGTGPVERGRSALRAATVKPSDRC